MRKLTPVLIVLLALAVVPGRIFAQETIWDKAKSPKYGQKAMGMFGRGLINVATCFVDVIVQTVEGTKEGTPFMGTLTGLGSGIGCTALRVCSGALDVATFWVPGFNGIPVSRSYSNCLELDEEAAPETAQAPTYYPPVSRGSMTSIPAPSAPSRDAMRYVKK